MRKDKRNLLIYILLPAIAIFIIIIFTSVLPYLNQISLENRLIEISEKDPQVIEFLNNHSNAFVAYTATRPDNSSQWVVAWDSGIAGLSQGIFVYIDKETEIVIDIDSFSG